MRLSSLSQVGEKKQEKSGEENGEGEEMVDFHLYIVGIEIDECKLSAWFSRLFQGGWWVSWEIFKMLLVFSYKTATVS